MTSYSHNRTPLLASPPVPLVISPLRHKTPSLPVMRHSPSLQTLNFHPLGLQPLNSFRAKLHSRPTHKSIVEDADSTPRPLSIKKIRKSPSMPFYSTRDIKPLPPLARREPPLTRSFLGLSFPPQPKPRSSSAGVLLADKMGNTPDSRTYIPAGQRTETIRRASSQRQSVRKELPGPGMAWLQRAKSVRPLSTLTPGSTSAALDDIESGIEFSPSYGYQNTRRESWQRIPKSRDSSGDATAGTSFRSSSLPSLDERSKTPTTLDIKHLKEGDKGVGKMRRISSASQATGNSKKHNLDLKNSNHSAKEDNPRKPADKTPTRGWKEKMFYREFFTRGNSVASPKKEAKTKTRERTHSGSSSTTMKVVRIPRTSPTIAGSNATRIDIPGIGGWSEHSTQHSRSSASSAWQLDGHVAASSMTSSGIRSANSFNDSVLGIFEGSVGGMGRTRLKKAGHWKSPTLQLQMEVVAEKEKVPISFPGGQANDTVVWVSVEIDGKVDKGTESFEGSKIGLDVGVLMDISAYTSNTSLTNMKLQAKRIVEAMETSRDRVAVMTFPVVPPKAGSPPVRREAVHVLNSSGSVAKKQLMDDIGSLTQSKWDLDGAAGNVREAVIAAVKKLKGMPLDTARYGTHRHGHLFLLTTKLEPGEIELLPEVFFGEIQIHIIGIGPLFWPRNEMGASGWCVPTGTLGPRPTPTKVKTDKSSSSASEPEEEINIQDIIQLLRKAVDVGAIQNLSIELRAGEHCSIRAVMGDLRYPKILPGEKRSLLVQVQVGDMPIPDSSNYDLDGYHEVMPRWVILERQLEATLGELKGRLLSVKATYRHSNFSETTIFSTEKNLEISRFAEDSLWRFSPTGNKLVNKEKSPPTTPITAEDYVKKVLIQRVASMHSSPVRALKAVQEIAVNSTSRAVSFGEISRELIYRNKVEQKFKAAKSRHSQSSKEELLIDLTDRSGDRTPTPMDIWGGIGATLGIAHSATSQRQTLKPEVTFTTPVNRDCRYHGSRELHNEDRAPFIAAMDSSPDTERPNIDPDDEAQRLWQEIKMRQRGFSSGSIKRRSVRSKRVASFYGREQLQDKFCDPNDCEDMLSTEYSSVATQEQEGGADTEEETNMGKNQNMRCPSGQETLHSLVTLRDVRETDFGPWAL